ncbi:hypothetical protein ACP70R_000470 [Stipagrostis hirtigluma subsp. patula]
MYSFTLLECIPMDVAGMGHKRPFLSEVSDDDDNDLEVQGTHDVLSDEDSESDSDVNVDVFSEGENSSDSDELNTSMYLQYARERKKLKKLKAKILNSMKPKDKKFKSAVKPKDAFTRFSVTYFSRVIDSLSSHQKDVIERYGFGSLLKFEKCYVPNKFAQWVARQVNYKTGDIVVKPCLIPFTRSSVHYVLDLPLGTRPFPKDSSAGKSVLLSNFNLQSVPSVKYFGNKLMKKDEELSDQSVFMCFILVALNCFLCPNSSLSPASKYLGIFEDLENIGDLDWSQFVLDWSLAGVRTFNKVKNSKTQDPPTLGCCLYLLVVYYLDFVDFGHKQVPSGLPRILYWKNSMIKEYSDLDEISPGLFGFRPVMDISRTCYSKQAVFLHKHPSYTSLDKDFLDKLDEHSKCVLPNDLKVSICNLLEEHSLRSALNFNIQITSLSSLSDELKKSFATLMEHAYSVDSRAQKLVLNLLKLLTEYEPEKSEEQVNDCSQNGQHLCTPSKSASQKIDEHVGQQDGNAENLVSTVNEVKVTQSPGIKNSQHSVSQVHLGQKSCLKQSSLEQALADIDGEKDKTPTHSNFKISNVHVQETMHKQVSVCKDLNSSSKSAMLLCEKSEKSSLACCCPPPFKKHKSKLEFVSNYVTKSDIASLRNPVQDTEAVFDEVLVPKKKSVKFVRENGERDVILLENPDEYIHDFASPQSPRVASRYALQKKSPSRPDDIEPSTPQTPMTMVTLEDSPVSLNHVTPLLSQPKFVASLKKASCQVEHTFFH